MCIGKDDGNADKESVVPRVAQECEMPNPALPSQKHRGRKAPDKWILTCWKWIMANQG